MDQRQVKRELATTPGMKPMYNNLTRKIRAGINLDYENWCNDNCNQLEWFQNTRQTCNLHKKIQELTRVIQNF